MKATTARRLQNILLTGLTLFGITLYASISPGSPSPDHTPPEATHSGPLPFVIDRPVHSEPITAYSEFMVDKGEHYSLGDVLSGQYNALFQPASDKIQRLGFSDATWWIRFALENRSPETRQLVVELEPGNVAEAAFFRPRDLGYESFFSGSNLDSPWADLHDRNQAYLVELKPGEAKTYYLRILPNHTFHYRLTLHSLPAHLDSSRLEDALFLLLFGVLAGIALHNLILARVSQHTSPMLYAGFMLSAMLTIALGEGIIGIQYFSMGSLYPRVELLSLLVTCLTALFFAVTFLHIKSGSRLLFLALRLIILVTTLLALVLFSMPLMLAGMLAYAITTLVALALFVTGYIAWRQRLTESYAYFASRIIQSMGAFFVILNLYGVITVDIELSMTMLVCFILEGSIMTAAMTRQYRNHLTARFDAARKIAIEDAIQTTRQTTLSRMSHEIRTPMSGILGMTEILGDTPLMPNQKDYVRAIQSSGHALLKIINDVLEYARLESGDMQPHRETFDLAELLMEVVELFRERAEEKGIELITHIHNNVPDFVEGDPPKLRQVLTNLIGACLRLSNQGEMMIEISHDPSRQGPYLRFELEGSALLQTEGELGALLAEDPEQDTRDSLSLSLSIARQLVEKMGGTTATRTSRQRGPVYFFMLPLPAVEGESPVLPRTLAARLENRTMLVVDDSPTVTRVIKQQALSWGIRVTACHDAREALASIRTQATLSEPYDIVILDHHMPGLNGIQLATRIQEDPAITHPIVLIMLTGIQDAPTAIMARNAGIHRVLAKPVAGKLLRRVLAEEMDALLSSDANLFSDLTISPDVRVLVVEDHPLGQKVIQAQLAKLNVYCKLVDNSRDALEEFKKGRYQLVLMDCELPEIDGFEITVQMREWEKQHARTRTPILALSAHTLKEHRDKSILSGMDAHLAKPVSLPVLKETIIKWTIITPHTEDNAPDDSPTEGNPG